MPKCFIMFNDHVNMQYTNEVITTTCLTSHESCIVLYVTPCMLRPHTRAVTLYTPDVCWIPQVEADDVLTKEEQMTRLINARNKCESSINSRHKTAGKRFNCIQTLKAF